MVLRCVAACSPCSRAACSRRRSSSTPTAQRRRSRTASRTSSSARTRPASRRTRGARASPLFCAATRSAASATARPCGTRSCPSTATASRTARRAGRETNLRETTSLGTSSHGMVHRLRSTRREQTLRPPIGRNDVDATEIERFAGRGGPTVVARAGAARGLREPRAPRRRAPRARGPHRRRLPRDLRLRGPRAAGPRGPGDGAPRGRKRVRNSQLQRLLSRPFSTRFG